MTASHIAALLWIGNGAALAGLVLQHDIRHHWPRIVAALRMER